MNSHTRHHDAAAERDEHMGAAPCNIAAPSMKLKSTSTLIVLTIDAQVQEDDKREPKTSKMELASPLD